MNIFYKDSKVIENKIEELLQQEWETNENYENDEVKKKISNILSKFLEGQWRIYLNGLFLLNYDRGYLIEIKSILRIFSFFFQTLWCWIFFHGHNNLNFWKWEEIKHFLIIKVSISSIVLS